MKRLLTIALALLAMGCSSTEDFDRYARCTVPTTRDAGMGVRIDGCSAWQFGRDGAR